MVKNNISYGILVIANLFPLIGVIWFGYTVFDIVLVYVLETVVIIFFTVIKIFFAQKESSPFTQILGKPANVVSRFTTASVFVISFIGFSAVQFVFVFNLFDSSDVDYSVVLWPVLVLFISHGVSLVVNYFYLEERKNYAPDDFFMRIFLRIFIAQAVVIFGGQFVIIFGSPMGALILLIVAKVVVDTIRYKLEHTSDM